MKSEKVVTAWSISSLIRTVEKKVSNRNGALLFFVSIYDSDPSFIPLKDSEPLNLMYTYLCNFSGPA